jgi:periplasmic protein TonB
MATCEQPSNLVHRVAYSPLGTAQARNDSRIPVLPSKEERRPSTSAILQGIEAGDLFHGLIATGNFRARSRWATAGAVIVESLLLLAIVAIPFFHTDPLPKRETVTKLYLAPPPALGASAAALQASRVTSRFTPKTIALPTPVHRMQEAPPAPVNTTSEVVGGVPEGMAGGVQGGVLSGMLGISPSMPVLAKTPETTPVKRVRVAARVAEANLIHDVPPQYPPEAGRERIEGMVVLMAVIGKDGAIKDLRVESGLPLLAQAAIDAVKQWRYKPYLLNGEPVEIDSRITINFTLSKG